MIWKTRPVFCGCCGRPLEGILVWTKKGICTEYEYSAVCGCGANTDVVVRCKE